MNRQDIYEPLVRYRDEFKEKFSSLCAAYLERMIKESSVDEKANEVLVSQIRKLEEDKDLVDKKRSFWKFMIFFAFLLLAGGGIVMIWLFAGENTNFKEQKTLLLLIGSILGVIAGIGLLFKAIPKVRQLSSVIMTLEEEINKKIEEAWQQLASLNALFRWETAAELIEQTVPKIQFDPFFTERRLHDLIHCFSWDNEYNEDKSVVCSHSGVINGNPFVFGELRKMEWGEKTYTGSLEITWLEEVKDEDGRYHTERRSEILTASVTKPIPVYSSEKILLYGNEAAPDLSFSREPSDLSGEDKGFFASLKKSSRLSKLKKFARNLDDDSNFTMMSNEDFEVLFHAVDRDDEVQFRLLFTPLAQQQMVNLLNDKKVGYGDDFFFAKSCCMNLIQAWHLNDADLNNDPEKFRHYDLKHIREYFQTFYEEFFKAVYFALAPLLTIPLYQQTRTRETIYGDTSPYQSCFWEHEALANYMGDEQFRHPECATECILKTSEEKVNEDGSMDVKVTAYGYRVEEQVESVRVYGRDGSYHWVDVYYDEYIGVEADSVMSVAHAPQEEDAADNTDGLARLDALLEQWQSVYGNGVLRRDLAACVKK